MRKPAIPFVQNDPTGVLTALKENIEIVTGRRRAKITELNRDAATLDDVIMKVNELLARLQD